MGNHHWSVQEIHIVQKCFHVMPDFEISRFIPERSILAISQKRRNMGLKYTQEWMNEQVRKQIIS
ncbi:MAG: hypothetical protein WC744_00525 [Patescibacteria group bacterium]|jgi:hypothetical protein